METFEILEMIRQIAEEYSFDMELPSAGQLLDVINELGMLDFDHSGASEFVIDWLIANATA